SSPNVSKRKICLPSSRKAVSVTVEKVHTKSFASATPLAALTLVEMVAVQVTFAGIGSATSDCGRLVGDSVIRTNVAFLMAASYTTDPKGSAPVGQFTLKLALFSVVISIA